MLVYMPTSSPLASMPPRYFEPSMTTGPSGTPSTHSQASSGTRPGWTWATTRSPYDCAYAETHVSPVAPTATSEYGPTRPIGMSSAQTHSLSMQNPISPSSQPVQSAAVSQVVPGLLPQSQPGTSESVRSEEHHV